MTYPPRPLASESAILEEEAEEDDAESIPEPDLTWRTGREISVKLGRERNTTRLSVRTTTSYFFETNLCNLPPPPLTPSPAPEFAAVPAAAAAAVAAGVDC